MIVQSFRDGFLPYHGAAVKEYIETLKATPRRTWCSLTIATTSTRTIASSRS